MSYLQKYHVVMIMRLLHIILQVQTFILMLLPISFFLTPAAVMPVTRNLKMDRHHHLDHLVAVWLLLSSCSVARTMMLLLSFVFLTPTATTVRILPMIVVSSTVSESRSLMTTLGSVTVGKGRILPISQLTLSQRNGPLESTPQSSPWCTW
jgi:uncharacterized membrane-anchored protein YitT (DUF2179 family)